MKTVRILVASLVMLLGTVFSVEMALAEADAQATNAQATNEQSASHVVNINTADAETLSSMLKGIGLKKAQAIVTHREKYGNFKTPGELTDVKGIGSATVAKNEAVIVLNK